MSLLSAVEQLIKSYKVQQARIHDSIQLYRGLALSLVPNPVAGSEESEETDDAATGADASSGEQTDMELLERALEKALRVRTSSEPSKSHPVKKVIGQPKEQGTAVQQASASSKGNPTTVKSSCKSAGLNRKVQKKPGSSARSSVGSKPSLASSNQQKQSKTATDVSKNHPASSAGVKHHKSASASGSADYITTSLSKNRAVKNNTLGAGDLRNAASVPTPSSHALEAGACSVRQHGGSLSSNQATKWKSLRCKQNRLWDKVMALQRKPVPGRSRFMERMRTTFPRDWPSGSPDQTRAAVDGLSRRGRGHLLLCLAKEVHARQPSETDAELGCSGGKKNCDDSSWRHKNLMRTTAELQNAADQVKREWKAWDRWRPEGGCLCTTGANGERGDGKTAPLPLTITYATEEELQELEKLRMRVALLQQELCLEQTLSDSLSPQLSSIRPGPGCPDPSVLRDLYSLLGEGGEHYPAIILDSEPD